MAAADDTPLARALKARIRSGGPISVADYMSACLNDPEHGYYSTQTAIGAAGDFITAPEISQIFGEIVGLWAAVVWEQMGRPPAVRLIELGPGRGTLMRDMLRATRRVAGFQDTLTVDLVESNATLRAIQQEALRGEAVPIRWHDSADAATTKAGKGATIVLANEFLDALPVEQFVFRAGRWHGRGVGLSTAGAFEFRVLDAAEGVAPDIVAEPRDGDILEARPDAGTLVRLLASEFGNRGPLAALFIDYGHVRPDVGDTLQAVRQQKHVSPFAAPGLCDLSAHVDFDAVFREGIRAGLAADGPVAQAAFLGSLGALERASRLMAANPGKAAAIETGVVRLMAPNGMGSRFKVLGLRSVDLPPLPGFATLDNAEAPA